MLVIVREVYVSGGVQVDLIYYFQLIIMRNRNKYDWSKPFKFIENKKQFDEIETNEESLIISILDEEVKPQQPPQKEDIPVPKIETVPRVTVPKKFAKITSNYIRLPPQLNLPLAGHYQLTQVDHIFLRSNENRFMHKGKRVLSESFLRKAIVELQLRAGKEMTLPRSKGWFTNFLEREHRELLEMEGVEVFAEIVYNYWKNRREELRFPLLRQLWRPSPDEYNHMLAFRPRERDKDKRALRRTNRVVQDEIIEELYEEFDLALKAADRVQMRQELKLKQTQLNINSFYAECKGLIALPDFAEIKLEQRVADRERIRNFHDELDKYRSRKESLENIKEEDSGLPAVDQKQSVVNFLATIVYEAEQLGISHQKIFYAGNSFVEKPKPLQVPGIAIAQELVQEIEPQVKQQQDEIPFSMSLMRVEDKLIRCFSQDEEETFHVKPCKDYLQYRRRKVDKYYFGQDDEGEVKDLRKLVSASFKKFVQMQQLSKNMPPTGEN